MGRGHSETRIDITNNRKFQDVCLLVDRPDFQEKLFKLSKKINKLPGKNNSGLSDYVRIGEELKLVNSLLLEYKYPPGFVNAILAALNNGVINDTNVKNCYSKLHFYWLVYKDKQPYYPKPNEAIISIYPYLLKGHKEIILNEIKQWLEFQRKEFETLPVNHPLTLDIKPKIKLARLCYWAKKDKIPTKILLNWINERKEKDERSDSVYIADLNVIDQLTSDYARSLKSVF